MKPASPFRWTLAVLCCALLTGAPGFAQAEAAPLDTDAFIQSLLTDEPGQGRVVRTAADCAAFAYCGGGLTISCTDTTSPAECTAVDRNCSTNQQGYVKCNGTYTWCSSPCCFNGKFCRNDGDCYGGLCRSTGCNCDA